LFFSRDEGEMAAANIGPFSKLLDFSGPVDVELVESTVNVFYGSGQPDQVRNTAGMGFSRPKQFNP
jgi:hypothetical protein